MAAEKKSKAKSKKTESEPAVTDAVVLRSKGKFHRVKVPDSIVASGHVLFMNHELVVTDQELLDHLWERGFRPAEQKVKAKKPKLA